MSTDLDRIAELARLALAIASHREDRLGEALEACAAHAGVTARDVEETILQGIPYSGFPGAGDALGRWREREEPAGVDGRDASHRGAAIFREVYGEVSDRVRQELRRRHPQLEEWIIDFAYGRVMGRGILSLADLEALGVASLLGQRRRATLHSHLRGAVRVGWTLDDLALLLGRLEPWTDPEIMTFARSTLEELAARGQRSEKGNRSDGDQGLEAGDGAR